MQPEQGTAQTSSMATGMRVHTWASVLLVSTMAAKACVEWSNIRGFGNDALCFTRSRLLPGPGDDPPTFSGHTCAAPLVAHANSQAAKSLPSVSQLYTERGSTSYGLARYEVTSRAGSYGVGQVTTGSGLACMGCRVGVLLSWSESHARPSHSIVRNCTAQHAVACELPR
jgi:hypothetical protein